MPADIIKQVRAAAAKHILFLPHAVRQMAHFDVMITVREVETVVTKGEIIEDYPEDVRGYSCLLLGYGQGGRPLHVVCAPKPDYLAIITAYLPDAAGWSADFKRRL